MDLSEELLEWVETFKGLRLPSKQRFESVWKMKGVGKREWSFGDVKRRSGEWQVAVILSSRVVTGKQDVQSVKWISCESVTLAEDQSCSQQEHSIREGVFITIYSLRVSIHKAQ